MVNFQRAATLYLQKADSSKAYVTAIVTNAALKVCSFKPEGVDLSKGTIGDHGTIDTPYVRFHKQLSTRYPAGVPFVDDRGQTLAKIKEHTVFIVQAQHLKLFLDDLEIP